MFRDDWSLDIFSLLGMGLSSYFSYKAGKTEGYKEYVEDARIKELDSLRREVEQMRLSLIQKDKEKNDAI